MPKKRSTVAMVFGILHLVVAGLGGLCLTVQLVGAATNMGQFGNPNPQQQRLQKEMEAKMQERLPSYSVIQGVEIGVKVLLTGLLIVGGIGLINMKMWGRTVSLIYAGISLLDKVVQLILFFAVIMPAMKPIFVEAGQVNAEQARAFELGMTIGGAGVFCVFMIYPLIVLIFMLVPSTAKGLRQDETDYPQEETFDRYEEDDRWGR
jgi:hypothetical protein